MEVLATLSIHKFVNSIGDDAGFAAFICVAVIGLLYFAQARETATLRDRLEDAQQRIGGLESRIAQLLHLQSARQPGQQAVAPGRVPQPGRVTPPPAGARQVGSAIASVRRIPSATVAAGTAPAARQPGAPFPGAPVGMGAPALASATKLIPDPALAPTNAGVVPTAAAAAPTNTGVATAAAAAAPADASVATAATAAAAAAPADASVATTAVTAAAAAAAAPADAVVASSETHVDPDDTVFVTGAAVTAAANDTADTPPPAVIAPRAADTTPPRVQIRPEGASGAPSRRTAPASARPLGEARFDVFEQNRPGSRSRLGGRRLPLMIGLLAVVVIIGGLVAITQSGNSTTNSTVHGSGGTSTSSSGSHKGTKHKAPPFTASKVTVAVLNGTGVSGLAADVSKVLSRAGYKPGSITNAASHTQTTTIVYFIPGHKTAALHVARQLKLSPASVQAATQTAIQSCATSPSSTVTSCSGNVIVSVGQDKASLASSASSSAG
jgi:LytR cell envelope-related transcriptional attenuator